MEVKKKTADRTLWRRGYGPVLRQTVELINE
jgi:hypothetical protein